MKIFLIFYNIILFVLLPFILPSGYLFALKKKEDKDYFERFGFINIKNRPEKSIWIHCASVGEVLSIGDFVARIRKKLPEHKIIVTTTTATGKSVAENCKSGDLIFLLPVENYLAIKYLTSYLNTGAFIILDTELWPNLVYAASGSSKLFLLNGRLSDRSFPKYKALKIFFSPILNRFNKIFTKSEIDQKRFEELSGKKGDITFAGNIKYIIKNEKAEIQPYIIKNRFFLAASTHKGEEEIIADVLKNRNQFEHTVIAPRHLNRVEEVCNIFSERGFNVELYSAGKPAEVIIVDILGILKNFYPYASKIFVGGSLFPNGGHNIFEGLVHKKIVATGKFMENFREIYELAVKHKVVVTIENSEDLIKFIESKESSTPDFDAFFAELGCKNENIIDDIIDAIKNEISH